MPWSRVVSRPRQYGRLFSHDFNLPSKGLGTPAGSLLLGSKVLITKAHRYRKAMVAECARRDISPQRDCMRWSTNVQRLHEDHAKAKVLEGQLRTLPYVSAVLPVETNIVIFRLDATVSTEGFLQKLTSQHIRALSMGKQTIRFVFHLDVTDEQLNAAGGRTARLSARPPAGGSSNRNRDLHRS